MEDMMWTIKAALFLVMELFVGGTLGAVLVAGLYEAVRDGIPRRKLTPAGRSHLPTRAS